MMQFHVRLVSCARYADSVADALFTEWRSIGGGWLDNNNNEFSGLTICCTRGINARGRPCIYHDDDVHSVCCELMTHYVPW